MTRIPHCRLSATFSAAWRHTVQVRNRLSPSFHSPAWLPCTGCQGGVAKRRVKMI
jgi:hypothetical protein